MKKRSILKQLRRDRRANHANRRINEVALWRAGKKVYITVPNPNTNETNKRNIRVDAKTVWGDPHQKHTAPQESSNE